MVDATAPSLMLAYGVGRIGCHLAGDGDWGIENVNPKPGFMPDWLWSYNYPHNVNDAGTAIDGCVGKYCNQLPIPVFPTPFYETIVCLILFLGLWLLRKRLKVPGTLFAVYLAVNGLERFFIEKIRVNNRMSFIGFHPTQAEIISALLFISGVGLFVILRRRAQLKAT